MVLDPSNSSNLEQLALKGVTQCAKWSQFVVDCCWFLSHQTFYALANICCSSKLFIALTARSRRRGLQPIPLQLCGDDVWFFGSAIPASSMHTESLFITNSSVYTVSQKSSNFELSKTLSNLNRFSKYLHCWKAYEICYKTHTRLFTSP